MVAYGEVGRPNDVCGRQESSVDGPVGGESKDRSKVCEKRLRTGTGGRLHGGTRGGSRFTNPDLV